MTAPRTRAGLRFSALAAALCATYCALFLPTLAFDLVWDDIREVRDNPLLRGPLREGLIAGQHAQMGIQIADQGGLQPGHDSFRPVRFLSLRADIELHGLSERGLHLHNVLLGLWAAAMAFLVAWQWLEHRGYALAVAGAFALHPVQVEPVAYVSARSDLLAGGFALAAAALCIRAFNRSETRRKWTHYVAAAVLLALSLGSKEAYLGLPLALGLLALTRGVLRVHLPPLLMLCGVVGAWLVLRSQFVHASGGGQAVEALSGLGSVLFQYVKIWALPFDCTTVRPATQQLPWLGTAVLVLSALGLWGLLRWRGQPLLRAVIPCFGWFVLLFLPTSVAVAITDVASDRYLYLPMLGLLLALAESLRSLAARPFPQRISQGGLVLWALMLVTVSFLQVPMWRDDLRLYSRATALEPGSSRAHFGLGYALARRGDCAQAIGPFRQAVELDPENVRAWNNLSVCHIRTGALGPAREAVGQALERSQRLHPNAWHNLATLDFIAGDIAAACDSERRVLALRPGHPGATKALAERCNGR